MSRFALTRIAALPLTRLDALRADRDALGAIDALLDREDALRASREAVEDALHDAAGEPGRFDDDPRRARARHALLHLRRAVHNGRPLPSRALRRAAPLLDDGLRARLDAHDALRTAHDALRERAHDLASCAAVASARAVARAAREPALVEGLALVSRALHDASIRLADRDPASWSHDERHAATKVAAYADRAAAKTSPNAVFAATAPAAIGGPRIDVRPGPALGRRDVILNVAEARKVAELLAADDAFADVVCPRVNATLRELDDGSYAFWRPATFRDETDDESLRRAAAHPVLARLVALARGGGLTRRALAGHLARETGHDEGSLAGFVDTAIEQGILLADVGIPYNERRPLAFVARAARKTGVAAPWVEAVEAVERGVERLASVAPLDMPGALLPLARAIDDLPHTRPLRHDELFRVDAASGIGVTLPGRVLDDLREGLEPYVRIFAAMYPTRLSVGAFAKRFLAGHPADRDVPLLDLYRGFLRDDDPRRPAAFPEPRGADPGGDGLERARERAAAIRETFARLARETPPGNEISLRDDEIRRVAGDGPLPAWTAGVVFQIAAPSADAVERGEHRLVLSDLFNGTGLALARFWRLHGGTAHGRNPVVAELRRSYAHALNRGELVAELTYNHVARTANAGLRPSLFGREIELPGDTASPGATVIPLTELAVRWDSSASRFRLRWTERDVDVQPVISSGVAPIGLFSFLVTLGQQDLQFLGLFPGFDVDGIRHWPRVVSGRLVLFRERWIFEPGEWPGAGGVERGCPYDAAHFVAACRWRRRHGLPRHVFVHTSEHPKPQHVDLESPAHVDLLRRATDALAAAGPGARLHVTEMLPSPDDAWLATDAGERHASEWLVQMEHGSRERADEIASDD